MQCLLRKEDRECKSILCPLLVGRYYYFIEPKTVLKSTPYSFFAVLALLFAQSFDLAFQNGISFCLARPKKKQLRYL